MAEEWILFDSDSSYLNMDSCVTRRLTSFKRDFIEGSYDEVTEISSDTNADKATRIGEGIAACTFKHDT